MRSPEKLKMDYIGYENPTTRDEVELEILGIELLIKCAEQRIALLKQGLKVSEMSGSKSNEESK